MTLDLPEELVKKAEAEAGGRGLSLQDFLTEALQVRLRQSSASEGQGERWRAFYGSLRHLGAERHKIESIVAEEFEQVDPLQWR